MEEKFLKDMTIEEIKALPIDQKIAILNSIRAREDIIDQDHLDNFTTLVDALNKDQLKEENAGYKAEIDSALNDAYALMESSPELKEMAKSKKSKERFQRAVEVGKSVADVITSQEQIDAGEAAQRASVKPAKPSRYKLDPNISRSIDESLRGLDAAGIEAQVNPMKQDIKDTDIAADSANKVASAGNAGTYAALTQARIGRRYKALRDLGTVRAGIRGDMLKNLNYSLQNRLAERRMQQTQGMQQQRIDMDQYNLEQKAAGALQSTGRENKRFALRGLADNVAGIAPDIQKLIQKSNNVNQAPGIQDPVATQSTPTNSFPITGFDSPGESHDYRFMGDMQRNLYENAVLNPFRGRVIKNDLPFYINPINQQ